MRFFYLPGEIFRLRPCLGPRVSFSLPAKLTSVHARFKKLAHTKDSGNL